MRTHLAHASTASGPRAAGLRLLASLTLLSLTAFVDAPSTAPPAQTPGVTLEGTVVLLGSAVPQPTSIRNTTDPDVCGWTHTLEDMLVSKTTRGIENAIVALEDAPAPDRASPPGRLVLDNAQCRFKPHASVLTVGSVIEMTNSDPVLHTVHFYGALEANIALPLKGMTMRHTVDKAGMIVVKCDVHGWMQAFIRVDPHPFHAVTDRNGSFRISAIPPGDYTFVAWHEKLGTQRKAVRIAGGATARVAIEWTAGDK